MAKTTQFPAPETYGNNWREWAEAHTDHLQKHLGSIEEPAVGHIVLYGGATPPTGYLKCDGSSFSAVVYPALMHRLAGNVLPSLSAPSGFSYAIRAR